MEPLVEIMEFMATETTTCNAADSHLMQAGQDSLHCSQHTAPGMARCRTHQVCLHQAADRMPAVKDLLPHCRGVIHKALWQWHDWQADS